MSQTGASFGSTVLARLPSIGERGALARLPVDECERPRGRANHFSVDHEYIACRSSIEKAVPHPHHHRRPREGGAVAVRPDPRPDHVPRQVTGGGGGASRSRSRSSSGSSRPPAARLLRPAPQGCDGWCLTEPPASSAPAPTCLPERRVAAVTLLADPRLDAVLATLQGEEPISPEGLHRPRDAVVFARHLDARSPDPETRSASSFSRAHRGVPRQYGMRTLQGRGGCGAACLRYWSALRRA
jgi:hypothetical protein